MAPVQPAWATDGATAHPAELARRLLAVQVAGYSGIIEAGALAVTARPTPDRSVDVAAGNSLIPATEAGLAGTWFARNDAVYNVATPVGDATNPFRVIIGARYDSATSTWDIVSISGTPAASPVDPTLPANFVSLARLTVQIPPNDTIVAGDIVDLRGLGWGIDTAFTPATLAGTWVNVAGKAVTAYRKEGRQVRIKGYVSSGTGTIFTLPVGYRPVVDLSFGTDANGAHALVDVSTSGAVSLIAGSNLNLTLSSVAFYV